MFFHYISIKSDREGRLFSPSKVVFAVTVSKGCHIHTYAGNHIKNRRFVKKNAVIFVSCKVCCFFVLVFHSCDMGCQSSKIESSQKSMESASKLRFEIRTRQSTASAPCKSIQDAAFTKWIHGLKFYGTIWPKHAEELGF